MDYRSNPFSSDPNAFGSLWLANLGYFGFMDKPMGRELDETGTNSHYDQTIQNSQSLKCSACNFTAMDQAAIDNHSKTLHKSKKMYPCHLCDFSTSNKGNLTYHISKHTGERPFKCEHCDHRARSAAYLKIHVRSRHTGEKPYSCPHCSFATPHANALKSHIAAKHTGDKKYKCNMCDFAAVHSGNLKYHINAKHKEKPFKCALCDYSAGHKGNLKTHIETKHTKDKKYKCPECDYSTGHQGNFKHHLRSSHGIDQYNSSDYVSPSFSESPSHSPSTSLYQYKCTQCPAYFHYPGELVSHITEKHENFTSLESQSSKTENAYKCDKCNFSTTEKQILESHVDDNHPEQRSTRKRMKCAECNFSTCHERHLEAHKKENHPPELKVSFRCAYPACTFVTFLEDDFQLHVKSKHLSPKANCPSESHSEYPIANSYQSVPEQEYSVDPHNNINRAVTFDNQSTSIQNAYKCTFCNFSTHQEHLLESHKNDYHSVQSKYCLGCIYPTCSYVCNNETDLQLHIKSDHLPQKSNSVQQSPSKYPYNNEYQQIPGQEHRNGNMFKCVDCNFSTHLEYLLETHKKENHSVQRNFSLSCVYPSCSFVVNHESDLQLHVKSAHHSQNSNSPSKYNNANPYQPIPGQEYSVNTRNKSTPIESQPNTIYKCTECVFYTHERHILETHKNENHPSQKGGCFNFQHKCPYPSCSFVTNQETDLQLHMNSKHLSQKSDCISGSPSKHPCGSQSQPVPAHEYSRNTYNSMNKTNKSIQCSENGTAQTQNLPKGTPNFLYYHTNTRESFKCLSCQYSCQNLQDFQRHLCKSHPFNQPSGFKCGSCNFFALDIEVQKSHLRNTHPSPAPFASMKCPESFYWSEDDNAQRNN